MAYEPVRPPFHGRFQEMSKAELSAYADWFHQMIPTRIAMLVGVVSESPGYENWQADKSPASVRSLGTWFFNHVEGRERTEDETARIYASAPDWFKSIAVGHKELTAQSFSFAFDVAVYLGEVFTSTYPSVSWSQYPAKAKSVDYGQPILIGFGKVAFNPVRMMITHAYGILQKKRDGESLGRLFAYWGALAEGRTPPPNSGIVNHTPENSARPQ